MSDDRRGYPLVKTDSRPLRLLTVGLALGLLLAGALGSICRAQSAPIESLTRFPRATLEIVARGHRDRFEVWIANTPPRQEQGLMFVRDLPAGQGMIFPQKKPQKMSMWMKNTYIELDIVFIGEKGAIDKIIEHAKPLDLTALRSDKDVTAVLELKGGVAADLGLKVGDRVNWTPPS
jgi:uncharacterized protein